MKLNPNSWDKTNVSYNDWLEKSKLRLIFNQKLKYEDYSLWWSTSLCNRDISINYDRFLKLDFVINNKYKITKPEIIKNTGYKKKFFIYLLLKLIKNFLLGILFNIFSKIFYKKNNIKNEGINKNCFFSDYNNLVINRDNFADRMYGNNLPKIDKESFYIINFGGAKWNFFSKVKNINKKLNKIKNNYYVAENYLSIKDICSVYISCVFSLLKLIIILRKKNYFIINKKDCSRILTPMLIESFSGGIQQSLLMGLAVKNINTSVKFSNFFSYMEFYTNARAIYHFLKKGNKFTKNIAVSHVINFSKRDFFFSFNKNEFSETNDSSFYSPKPDIFFSNGMKYSKFLKSIFSYTKNIYTIGSLKHDLKNLKEKKNYKKKIINKNSLLIILGNSNHKKTCQGLNNLNLSKYNIILKTHVYDRNIYGNNVINYFNKNFKFKFKTLKQYSTRELIKASEFILVDGETSLSVEALIIKRKKILRLKPENTIPIFDDLNYFIDVTDDETFQKNIKKKISLSKNVIKKIINDYFFKYDNKSVNRFLKIIIKRKTLFNISAR